MKISVTKILLLLVAASIGTGVWYMTKKRPLPVEIASVEKNIEVKVFGLGTVEARVLSKIGFKVSNPIVLINVDEGDQVSKGDILARLDDAEQQARVAKAEAGVKAADAALKGAKSSIQKAETVLIQKNRSNDRKQALYKNRTIPADTAETAELERDTAKADLDIAKSLLLSATSALETARAQLALEKVMLDQHILRAPYAGTIIGRHLELGTVVKSGEPLFTLVDPKTVWVLGHISESRSGLIAIGQVAQIRLRSRPHNLYSGKVERIDVESDRVTEERQVYISCEGCLDQFNLGEQAEVYVTTVVLEQAIFVPENAVDNFDERQMRGTVWVLEDGKLRKQNVTFGHRTLDARLSISQGLGEGAEVLTRLPKILQEGRSAKVSLEETP
ncbi:MAG: efflux RND transporter periplasmic adaptor subunit [Rhizobiaceae bacterium]